MPTRKGNIGQRRAARQAASVTRAQAEQAATPAEMPAEQPLPAEERSSKRNVLYPLGANLYPLDTELASPDDWYARDLADDLESMGEARLSLVRLFVSWREFEPQVGQYSEDALERFADLLDACKARKMQAIVTFFADDRHAELVDVGWGKRRNPRTDGYMVQREVALVSKVVGRFRADPTVFAWDLANEAFCAGFPTAEDLSAWVAEVADAVRELDPDRPLTLGVDAETLFRATGVDAREVIDSLSFSVSHVTAAYRAYAAQGPLTSGPGTYLDAFLLRLAQRGKPVILDDVGVLSLESSVGEEAAYVRTVLWSGFMNRAAGALVRRWRDLQTERREPYFIDPYEALVGVADEEGDLKPAFDEVRAFSRLAAKVDLSSYQPPVPRTAIVVADERYDPLPSLAGLFDPRACLSAYIGAVQAHLPTAVVGEREDFADFSALVVPSAFALADDTWERLSAFVQSGGSLILSYGGGDAHPSTRELFGVEFLGDGGARDWLSCRIAQPDALGPLTSFDAALEIPSWALLSAVGATVVATDEKGSPLLTVNQFGQGKAVFIATPLERAIAQDDPWATPEAVQFLLATAYGTVARGAGAAAPVDCDTRDVEVALFQGESDDVLLLLNHSPIKTVATVSVERRVASITDVRGGAPVAVGGTSFGVPLGPNQTAALRLAYA